MQPYVHYQKVIYTDPDSVIYRVIISSSRENTYLDFKRSKRDIEPVLNVIKILSHFDRSYKPTEHVWTLSEKGWKQINPALEVLTIAFIEHDNLDEFIDPALKAARLKAEKEAKFDDQNFFYEQAQQMDLHVLTQKLMSLLEVAHTSDLTKSNYRKAALRLHPDRNSGDGSKMSELNSLWSVYNAQ